MDSLKEKYFKTLKTQYPNRQAVATEIANLNAILNLPKATEHFLSDIHGEYDAFRHVLRNGSGNVKRKISDLFGTAYDQKRQEQLALLVYYPAEIFSAQKKSFAEESAYQKWCGDTIWDLVALCRFTATKYTRSKVRKALPKDLAYIIEELLYQTDDQPDKAQYYQMILTTIFELELEGQLIQALADLIQRFVVDHLHIVGDIFDRGPHPDKIIDSLMNYHSLDIQWGNHDILWMAAACGVEVCIATVVRICARYDNLAILEDIYGINLRPLLNFAEANYGYNPIFKPKGDSSRGRLETEQVAKIHQAISLIQFKLEGELVKRQPEFQLSERNLLEKIRFSDWTIQLEDGRYALDAADFPTVTPEAPNRLTTEERELLAHLTKNFLHSEKLQRQVRFLFRKGRMYQVYNGNLLYHGCIPLETDHSFKAFSYEGKRYFGKALLDFFDDCLQELFESRKNPQSGLKDLAWYVWAGECSPLFGKRCMKTFERYFINDTATHHEARNPYYQYRDEAAVCRQILAEFGVDPAAGHIINGHTPIQEIKGENPIKADGKMIVIDGGFSKAYQKKTGLAGYTLLYNSYGMELAAHQPFTSKKDAIQNGTDIISARRVIDRKLQRKRVKDTTIGQELQQQLQDLQQLYRLYY